MTERGLVSWRMLLIQKNSAHFRQNPFDYGEEGRGRITEQVVKTGLWGRAPMLLVSKVRGLFEKQATRETGVVPETHAILLNVFRRS